jgi:predicted alpha/beta-fold hydrolase
LQHAQTKGFTKFLLIGFSAGGSIILNFLGKHPADAVALGVVAAAAISTPLDLEGCAKQLETPGSLYYNHRFCRALNDQLRQKAAALGAGFPIDVTGLAAIKTLRAFDDHITAPLHGFASAKDYYNQCSASRLLTAVPVPTLIWSAQNDPFLSSSCYFPEGQFGQNPNVVGQFPAHGGHCGYSLCTAAPIIEALASSVAWKDALN